MKIPSSFWAAGITITLVWTSLAASVAVAQTEVSQIIITSYTGRDTPRDKAGFIYRIALERDGNAIYVGSKTYAKRVGRYQGTVTQEDFEKLARLLHNKNHATEPDTYNMYKDPGGREVGKVTYEVLTGNRKRTVTIYEDSGPKRFKQAGHIWYGLIWKIPWQEVSASDAIVE